MVEFKAGKGGPKLIEIWGSLPLAVYCGMDFPARLAEMYIYGPPVAKRSRIHLTPSECGLEIFIWR
jgi:hypothetical protein